MSFRVLIPTAGTGSRLGDATHYLNKSLVSIANRPTISHIIELFPDDVEFVVALGHKGQLVKDFLKMAYPNRKFFFADVYPFEGLNSGLGLSILKCKEYLQQPFVFISCDTLVKESVPFPDHNWMGYAELEDTTHYRSLKTEDGKVKAICEKDSENSIGHKPYIGLAGIYDYEIFWKAMESGGDEAIAIGESYGMRSLTNRDVEAYSFTWFDTGNQEALKLTREAYRQDNEPNILEKANEAIWFIDNNVIKFSDDAKFIANRVARVSELKDYIPKVTGATRNMYIYTKAEGDVFSKVVTLPVFEKLLEYSKLFWTKHDLNMQETLQFRSTCMQFYKVKTEERIDLFYKNFNREDGIELINGISVPTLKELLNALDWNWLADGLSSRFHGDFHFENILYCQKIDKFTFLDWRQDFGGSLTTGDIYYDLAKLLHGLIICHELIAENHFRVDWQKDEILFDFHRKQQLVECENYFADWLTNNGYDKKKVWVLTALIYLNIAALHHYPYSLLLYGLGKKMLFENI